MKTKHRLASRAKHRYIPGVTYTPFQVASYNASKLSDHEQADLMKPPRAAMEALQFGGFGVAAWRDMADFLNLAEGMAGGTQGVNLANDHAEKFAEAQNVLLALKEQFDSKQTWTARAGQLQTLRDAIEIYEIQLSVVSHKGWFTVLDRVSNVCREARRGNSNKEVVQVVA
jgi:hypothetical protein